jgi:hypothetical protein
MNAASILLGLLIVLFMILLLHWMRKLKPQMAGFQSQSMCPSCGLITSRLKASCLECGKPLKAVVHSTSNDPPPHSFLGIDALFPEGLGLLLSAPREPRRRCGGSHICLPQQATVERRACQSVRNRHQRIKLKQEREGIGQTDLAWLKTSASLGTRYATEEIRQRVGEGSRQRLYAHDIL